MYSFPARFRSSASSSAVSSATSGRFARTSAAIDTFLLTEPGFLRGLEILGLKTHLLPRSKAAAVGGFGNPDGATVVVWMLEAVPT